MLPNGTTTNKDIANWVRTCLGAYSMNLGLLKDDLIPEDHPVVQQALSRLTEKEIFDRTFRLKRATELSFRHEELPLELQPRAENDVRYLRKHMLQILRESAEQEKYESDK
jgi:ubiquinol-cytochrome c reductase subunit 7